MSDETVSHRTHRVAVIALHPIQYQAGLWREMASQPKLDVRVLYLDSIGVDGSIEPVTGRPVKWDVPLLEGYSHEFVPNWSPWVWTALVHRVNPRLLSLIWRGGYSAIVVHGYVTLSNWLALAAARVRGTRVVFRGEGTLLGPRSTRRTPGKAFARMFSALFLKACDAIAYSCEDNRQYLLSRGAPAERLFPMPCAVDNRLLAELAESASDPANFRAHHGIPPSAVVVISVGQLIERKRMQDAIEALAAPPLRGLPEVHLVIIGNGPERERLEAQARALGLEGRVHLLGFLGQRPLVEALLASDLFVIGSSEDPSPKALSEALFLGLPAICSDRVGTCPELVEHGRNGFSFPCGNLMQLASRIAELVPHRERRREMGKESRRIAKQNDFAAGVEAMVRKLDELEGRR